MLGTLSKFKGRRLFDSFRAYVGAYFLFYLDLSEVPELQTANLTNLFESMMDLSGC